MEMLSRIAPIFSLSDQIIEFPTGKIHLLCYNCMLFYDSFSQLRKVVHFWTLACFYSFGLVWRCKGKKTDMKEFSSLILAPHSAFCDAVAALVTHNLGELPYAISRAENLKVPFIGSELYPECRSL